MIKLFKSIWKFFFRKKKVPVYNLPKIKEPMNFQDLPEVKSGKVFGQAPSLHTQLFCKQQLPGKIFSKGKSRFRVIDKSTLTHPEKIRYEITHL